MAASVGPAGPVPAVPEPVLVLAGDLAGRVVVRAVGDELADRAPEVRVIGGGPTNGVPSEYQVAIRELCDVLEAEAWTAWWASSGETLLEISYDYAPARLGHRVRRTTKSIKATLVRGTGSDRGRGYLDGPGAGAPGASGGPGWDPVQAALDDVVGLMSAVRDRFGLAPLPALPTRDEIESATRDEAIFHAGKVAEQAREDERIAGHVQQLLRSVD